MRTKTLLLSAFLIMLLLLILTGRPDTGVGQSAYTGTISVSPASVCVGDSITISGTGAPPGTDLYIYMLGGVSQGYEGTLSDRRAEVGSTRSDGAGNWSLTATAPATAQMDTNRGSGGCAVLPYGPYEPYGPYGPIPSGASLSAPEEVPVTAETWLVDATGSNYHAGYAELTVLNCSILPDSLPDTGAETPFPYAVIMALLAVPVVAVLLWRWLLS